MARNSGNSSPSSWRLLYPTTIVYVPQANAAICNNAYNEFFKSLSTNLMKKTPLDTNAANKIVKIEIPNEIFRNFIQSLVPTGLGRSETEIKNS